MFVETQLLVDSEDDLVVLGQVSELGGGGRAQRQRFLAQHVAPGGQHPASDAGLGLGRHGHVHHLDLAVGEQAVEVRVDALYAVAVCHGPGPVAVDVGYADDPQAAPVIGG